MSVNVKDFKKKSLKILSAFLYLLVSAQAILAQIAQTGKRVLEPTVFAPGIISTGDYEGAEEFAPDGKTLYFIKSTPDFNFWTIVFSNYENGCWNEPLVAPFSGQYSDADPFITADGKEFFFVSRRPVNSQISPNKADKLDIWTMEKTGSGWSEPKNLGAPVNSEANEYFPTLTRDGKTLYFGSRRAGGFGSVDLYRSKFGGGKWTAPENLGDAINSAADEFEPFIAPDESYLIFMAGGRADGLGGFDLYISRNENGKWTKAQNLGAPINSTADELSAKITRDGRYLFWTSTRSRFSAPLAKPLNSIDFFDKIRNPGNGLGDIYFMDAANVLKIANKN